MSPDARESLRKKVLKVEWACLVAFVLLVICGSLLPAALATGLMWGALLAGLIAHGIAMGIVNPDGLRELWAPVFRRRSARGKDEKVDARAP